MPLITDSEMEDFDGAILQAGFEVDDFHVVDMEDETTLIEQYFPTGTVTIQRISIDEAITYRAGHGSSWVKKFEADLQAGNFGQP